MPPNARGPSDVRAKNCEYYRVLRQVKSCHKSKNQVKNGYSHRSFKPLVKRGLSTLSCEDWNRRRALEKPAVAGKPTVAGSTEETSRC